MNPNDRFREIEDAMSAYGAAEYELGAADVIGNRRARDAADAEKDRLLAMLHQIIFAEETVNAAG